MTYARVLSIAGSDCSGGAGVQADVKTITVLGCYAATAITALVDEDTTGVKGTIVTPVDFVLSQIATVLDDIGADAIKTGMLPTTGHIEAVADLLERRRMTNVVVDPVMVATSGDSLQEAGAVETLRERLIPRSRIFTPNVPEAEALLGRPITQREELRDAAAQLSEFGASVLLKGGHLEGDIVIDVLCNIETHELIELPAERIATVNTHGTGCTLSSAVASYLALGRELTPAVVAAKRYMTAAITQGANYKIGHGHGPVKHNISR